MPCTSRAKTRHCSGRSTSCQGVSVPPQSKTTASTGRVTRGRSRRAPRRRHRRDGDLAPLPGAPVLELEGAVGEAAADDDDRRHADELGVLELHTGRRLPAVVEEHLDPLGLEGPGELLGVGDDGVVLAGGDDVHVGGRQRPRPDEPELVVVALGDARDGARDPDAVGAHDDGAQLAVLVEHLEVEGLGVLGAQLEDVPHLDAARRLQAVPARRAGVAVAHLGGLDGAVGGEVAPGDEVEDVPPALVGAGDPRRARRRPAGRAGSGCPRPSRRRARPGRCSPWRARVGREVLLVERLHRGRLDLGAEPLLVDLAVAGQADGQRLAGAVGVDEHDDDVLQRVGRRPRPAVRAGERRSRCATRVSMVGVSGVSSTWAAGSAGGVDGVGHRHPHGLDVGRVAAVRAADVGVLAVLGRREELLGLRAAHGAGHRLDDDVVEAEPVEDPHVGVAVQLVALVEPGLVEVEGVAVLHDELAPAQQPGPRPRLVAVLGLDLVDRRAAGPCTTSTGP